MITSVQTTKEVSPDHKKHRGNGHRKQGDGGYYYRVYGHETGKASWGKAMGIDWMRSPELTQAIPPAYSEYIARQYSKALAEAAGIVEARRGSEKY